MRRFTLATGSLVEAVLMLHGQKWEMAAPLQAVLSYLMHVDVFKADSYGAGSGSSVVLPCPTPLFYVCSVRKSFLQ